MGDSAVDFKGRAEVLATHIEHLIDLEGIAIGSNNYSFLISSNAIETEAACYIKKNIDTVTVDGGVEFYWGELVNLEDGMRLQSILERVKGNKIDERTDFHVEDESDMPPPAPPASPQAQQHAAPLVREDEEKKLILQQGIEGYIARNYPQLLVGPEDKNIFATLGLEKGPMKH